MLRANDLIGFGFLLALEVVLSSEELDSVGAEMGHKSELLDRNGVEMPPAVVSVEVINKLVSLVDADIGVVFDSIDVVAVHGTASLE